MTDKLFDSFISNKLKNHESSVPEGLWEKIIEKEERKPKVIWWRANRALLLMIVLLLSGSGYLTFQNINKNVGKNVTNNTILNNTSNPEITRENLLKSSSNKDENTTTEPKIGSENLAVVSEKINDKKSKTASNEKETSTTSVLMKNLGEVKKNTISNSTTEMKLFSYLNKTANNQKKAEKDSKNAFLNNISSNTNTKKFGSLDIIQNTNASKQLDVFNRNEMLSKTNIMGNTVGRAFDLNTTYQLNTTTTSSQLKLFTGTDDCPTAKGVYRNDFYIEGYASPDFAYKSINNTKSNNDLYLQKKDSSETMRLGFTVGARFSKSITNNLLIKAGIQYSQFNEKLVLRTENERKQIIVISSRIITRSGQPDTTIYDTTTTLQIGYRVRSNIIRYKNLEIPILLSYEISQPESKWKLAISGGAIVNLASWYDGKTFDSTYSYVNTGNKANTGFYQHKVGVSLYGSVSIIKNLNDIVDVFAEPYFRFGLNNNLQSNGGFTQKFNVFGVQFGARIKINKNKHL